jgi:hypothetical protein
LLTSSCGADNTGAKAGTLNTAVTDSAGAGPAVPTLDTALYEKKWQQIANGDSLYLARAKQAYPLPGAILPFNRIIAYYGNLYSKRMGILGELPETEMLDRLQAEVKAWQQADSSTTAIPALHYIAVTAQGSPGKDGKYRLRMPLDQIDKVLASAAKINAIVFIDIQVGLSTLESEVPLLQKYLAMPNVHLGIDPEFSMKDGTQPGKKIGTFDAVDINYTSAYLAKLVKDNKLPPKILVVHRFTKGMVTGYANIQLRPEVQLVMNMDGWGAHELKAATYRFYITREPVQFAGFKLFYKNDLKMANSRLMTPAEILQLKPHPVYIQYQ